LTTHRPSRLLWITFALALLVLPACERRQFAAEVPEEALAAIPAPAIQESVSLLDCIIHPGDICAADPGCVPNHTITDLTPTFSWTYHCTPDAYKVIVTKPGAWYPVFVAVVDEYDAAVDGPRRSWTPDHQLDPGSHYRWTVRPLISSDGIESPTSAFAEFWTGPRCDPATMQAPDLSTPFHGESIDTPGSPVQLRWEWLQNDCIPDGYEPQLSTHANFSDLVPLDYETGWPQTHAYTQEVLEDCQRYYWRVRAISLGVNGPFSDTRTFTVSLDDWNTCLNVFPSFELLQKATCRLGYGTDYPPIRYFGIGETLEITGRNRQMTWLKLGDCWVAASLGKVLGELELVPVLSSPPLPTPTPSPLVCTSQLNRGDCKDAGGEWTETVAGQPYCACPK
jgi:hypothetical protein